MKKFFSSMKEGAVKHGPGISIIAGVVGLVASNVFTFFGTIKSVRKIDEVEKELGRETTNKEKIKYCWKHYIPSVTTIVTGASAVIGGDQVKTKRFKREVATNVAALAAEKANFEDYKDVVKDKLNEKQQEEVNKEYREKQSDRLSPAVHNPNALTDDQFYCFDETVNAWYAATQNEIDAAVNKINRKASLMEKSVYDEYFQALEDIQEENGTDGYRQGKPIPRASVGKRIGWIAGQEITAYTEDVGIRPNDNKPAVYVYIDPSPRYDKDDYIGL